MELHERCCQDFLATYCSRPSSIMELQQLMQLALSTMLASVDAPLATMAPVRQAYPTMCAHPMLAFITNSADSIFGLMNRTRRGLSGVPNFFAFHQTEVGQLTSNFNSLLIALGLALTFEPSLPQLVADQQWSRVEEVVKRKFDQSVSLINSLPKFTVALADCVQGFWSALHSTPDALRLTRPDRSNLPEAVCSGKIHAGATAYGLSSLEDQTCDMVVSVHVLQSPMDASGLMRKLYGALHLIERPGQALLQYNRRLLPFVHHSLIFTTSKSHLWILQKMRDGIHFVNAAPTATRSLNDIDLGDIATWGEMYDPLTLANYEAEDLMDPPTATADLKPLCFASADDDRVTQLTFHDLDWPVCRTLPPATYSVHELLQFCLQHTNHVFVAPEVCISFCEHILQHFLHLDVRQAAGLWPITSPDAQSDRKEDGR
jgi:hypothetical protein